METTIYPRWEQKLESYRKALNRLAEIVNCSKERSLTEFERDGLVQRFEFTHEMAWKLMMSFCKFQSPEEELFGSKDSTRWAANHELLEDGETWMDMIRSRNLTSHNYDGEVAESIVKKVSDEYFPLMQKFLFRMQALAQVSAEDLFNQ